MRSGIKVLVFGFLALAFASCTEDIVIDLEEGSPLVGVEASFSNEMKCHETILSYTADFYNQEDIRMISGAQVYVTDGVDTVYYYEDAERKGHYFTEPVAGKKNTMYRLCVDVPEADGAVQHYFAECLIPDNVEQIDSLVIKPYSNLDDTIPTVLFGDTIEWVYPYFQSLPDPNIVYAPAIYKNDTLLNDTLTQQSMIPIGGYAGYYINGPEMTVSNREIPVYAFRKRDLRDGDRIRVCLRSISMDYLYYYYSLMMSMGNNPMMGAPANVATNIQPSGKCVGWFFTVSVVFADAVFEDK